MFLAEPPNLTMKLTLEYECPVAGHRQVWLRYYDKLVIGSGHDADLCIDTDKQLAKLHFVVAGGDGGWNIVALEPQSAPVDVNGSRVTRHTMSHGDTIVAGQTRFRVIIEQGSSLSLFDTASKSELASPLTSKIDFGLSPYPSGVVEFQVRCEPEDQPTVVEALATSRRLFFAINATRWGKQTSFSEPGTDDLYKAAPPEIRQTESLSIVSPADDHRRREISHAIAIAGDDAASLIVTSLTGDSLLESHQFVWAWFARPSILRFQLANGSSHLGDQLLQNMFCLIAALPSGENGLTLFASRPNAAAISIQLDQLNKNAVTSAAK